MDRRNLLLNEMGITRWQLHRPEVLQGAVGVSVSEQVKFIVVAKDNVSNSPLFSDVRLALELNKEDCLCLNFDQIQHITLQHSVRYWLLAENADEIDRTLLLNTSTTAPTSPVFLIHRLIECTHGFFF